MVIVAGEILMDVFDTYQRIGGAPFNFAFHLKQMGRAVRFITRVGDDARGREIMRLLQRRHFDLNDVQIDPHRPTGTVQVTVDRRGVPTFDIKTEVAYDYLDLAAAAPIDWPSVRLIYFGTLAQRTAHGFRQVERLLARKRGQTKAFCDINLRPPHVHEDVVRACLQQADLLKLNSDELTVVRSVCGGPAQEQPLIQWLMNRFAIEMLILTKGEDGSAIYTDKGCFVAAAPQAIRVVDTVGAGDAYAAVLAEGYMQALPPDALAKAAGDFAAVICAQPGAVPEDRSVYRQLRRRLKGTADAQ